MFDPTKYPYVRAATYADANPPPVLSDVFYNPTQDAVARQYGAQTGYSTSIACEDFFLLQLPFVPTTGDPLGVEMTAAQPGTGFGVESIVPPSPNLHGVLRIRGAVNGNRGGTPGFEMIDAYRYLDEARWIFRCRFQCNNFAVATGGADPGIVIGLGSWAEQLPVWYSNAAGFWGVAWDGGAMLTSEPTVDNDWVELWIARDLVGGAVKWYFKLDTDVVPRLIATKTLSTASLSAVRRYLQYEVSGGAVIADNVEVDAIAFGCER